jgi:flagellar basal-body rod protein FlgB
MKMNALFGQTMASLERSLNRRALNQKLIVSNIANLDTPNFKAFKMVADEAPATIDGNSPPLTMTRTQAAHMGVSSQAMETAPIDRVDEDPLSMRGDGNTVELDKEMANLAENTLMYNTATRIIANKFSLLKDVIKGGQ